MTPPTPRKRPSKGSRVVTICVSMCGWAFLVILFLSTVAMPIHDVPEGDTHTAFFDCVNGDFSIEYSDGEIDKFDTTPFLRGTASVTDSPLFITVDDPIVERVYSKLNENMEGMDEHKRANYMLDFVQRNITYVSDKSVHGTMDYIQYPAETLVMQTGDCEDFATLLLTFYKMDGLDAVFLKGKNHLSVGVHLEDVNLQHYYKPFMSDKRYYVAEATGESTVGNCELEGYYIVAYPDINVFGIEIMLLSAFIITMGAWALMELIVLMACDRRQRLIQAIEGVAQ